MPLFDGYARMLSTIGQLSSRSLPQKNSDNFFVGGNRPARHPSPTTTELLARLGQHWAIEAVIGGQTQRSIAWLFVRNLTTAASATGLVREKLKICRLSQT